MIINISFCFPVLSTKFVEASVQDLSAVKESRPPVPEDRAAREARHLSAAQKKGEKDAAKKRQVRKVLEREALNKRCRQQSLEGLPIEESPLRRSRGRMRTAATTTPGRGMIPRLFWCTFPTYGP
jgi:hypothetical protein